MTITESRRERGGRSFLLPVLLMGAGVLLLLSNLGVIGWSLWTALFRLWPVLLIAIGLDLIIGRRSAAGSLIVMLVTLGMVAVGLVYYLAVAPATAAPVGGQTMSISQPLEGASSATVEIRSSVARLDVGAHSDGTELAQGQVQLVEGEQLVEDFRVSDNRAHLSLRSDSPPTSGVRIWPFAGGWPEERDWTLRLNNQVPMELSVVTGAGQSNLDLSELTLTELTVNIGAGQTTITLPEQGSYSADIRGGVGEIVVYIPEDVAARIDVRSGIGSVDVDGAFRRDDDVYMSPGYDTATNRVDLTMRGGVGRIGIEQGRR